MAFVQGVGRAGIVGRAASPPAARGGGFNVAAHRAAAAGAPAATAEVSLGAMLAIQETESAAVRDRAARRRGQDMLAALAALQRALLVGGSDPGDSEGGLGRLAALTEQVPEAADPALREAVAAVTLRARVELARHGSVTGR
jgi:hypothetical protein